MSRQEWRGLRSRLTSLVLPGVSAVLGRSSPAAVRRFGVALGAVGWRLSRRDRARAIEHLGIAFPEMSPDEHRRLARACFRHLGLTGAECLHLMRQDCTAVERSVEVDGWENVEAVRADGRPVLILTGHCGNWELLAATINCRGLGMSVIARRANDPRLSSPIVELRQRFGTETINRAEPGASRKLLTALRAGALGMLIDQDTQVKGAWVPFFGRPAYTPVGAAEIALKRDAGVVPSFIARQPDGRHRAVFHPVLDLPADAAEATAMMTAAIEAQIRRYPEQWVWMHRRWRRQPDVGHQTSESS